MIFKILLAQIALIFSFLLSADELPKPLITATIDDLLQVQLVPVQVDGKVYYEPTEAWKDRFKEHYKGKWLIINYSAVWCPYCSLDQLFFASQRNEKNDYSVDSLQIPKNVVRINFYVELSGKGDPYDLSFAGAVASLSPETLETSDYLQGIDRDGIDTFFVFRQEEEPRFSQIIFTKNGENLFTGLTGFPFQMIFNPEGKMISSGQYTKAKDGEETLDPYKHQYKIILDTINNNPLSCSLLLENY